MSETLISVGLDVGTTSTQVIFSALRVENRATGFAVPELAITDRKILYRSPVHFTPLLDENHVDGEKIREILRKEYENAGITRVDTGAVIITGETGRKENARAVLHSLSDFAGDFVVATAGPELESILAARGAGAVEASEGRTLLHLDIGGGTSNLALLRDGKILDTGCLNIGGRLLRYREDKTLLYVSPVLKPLTDLMPGDTAAEENLGEIASRLTEILEMGVGLREESEIFREFVTREGKPVDPALLKPGLTFSFSGGVADCIDKRLPWDAFGDLGPLLGQAIRKSRLCAGEYRLGAETIRATVIGAGCHSAQLSGSTVFWQNVHFPQKNLPVVEIPTGEGLKEAVLRGFQRHDGPVVLSLEGYQSPGYPQIAALAVEIRQAAGENPLYLAVEQDMAKALGQALALQLGPGAELLCIDRVRLREGSFLDVGAPVGPALPVVVKTLILGKEGHSVE